MPTLTFTVTHKYGALRRATLDQRTAFFAEVSDLIRQVTSGLSVGASIQVVDGNASVAAVQANGTFTFTGNGTAADTVTIAGQAFTAVASGAGNNQWNIGTSTTTAAANLAAAINASTTATFAGTVYAVAVGAIVTVFAIPAGAIGNLVTIAKTSTSITVSGANLAGGVSAPVVGFIF
jgi:hypothetical protein